MSQPDVVTLLILRDQFNISTPIKTLSEFSLGDVWTYSKAKITYVIMFYIYHDYTTRMQVQTELN